MTKYSKATAKHCLLEDTTAKSAGKVSEGGWEGQFREEPRRRPRFEGCGADASKVYLNSSVLFKRYVNDRRIDYDFLSASRHFLISRTPLQQVFMASRSLSMT